MNRDASSLVHSATMPITHVILSIQPFPYAILVITSSDYHSHSVISPDGNPRKPYSVALQLDFSPTIQPHPAIPPTEIHGNAIPRHSTAFQLDFRGIMRDNAMRQQFRIK